MRLAETPNRSNYKRNNTWTDFVETIKDEGQIKAHIKQQSSIKPTHTSKEETKIPNIKRNSTDLNVTARNSQRIFFGESKSEINYISSDKSKQ